MSAEDPCGLSRPTLRMIAASVGESLSEEEQRRVEALGQDLGHDELEVREKASRELAGMGSKIAGALARLQQSTQDPEILDRISTLERHMAEAFLPPRTILHTALALEAFLGAGFTPSSRERISGQATTYGKVVKGSLRFLLAEQKPDGHYGNEDSIWHQAWACIAMSEAYGMTEMPELKESAQKALDFLLRSQNEDGGWAKGKKGERPDPMTTFTALLVLRRAMLDGLQAPQEPQTKLFDWIERQAKGGLPEGPILLGLLAIERILRTDDPKDALATQAAHALIDRHLPNWDEHRDYSAWMVGSHAIFFFDGPRGPLWKKWGAALTCLVPHRIREGCAKGAWEPDSNRDTLLATCFATECLYVYYRYPRVALGRFPAQRR